MTYLELINAVMDRLRENRLTSGELDGTPWTRMVGTCVNDAKTTVENSWNWSHLRGYTDIVLSADQQILTITDSADVELQLARIHNTTQGYFLEQKDWDWMERQYKSGTTPSSGNPRYYASYYNDTSGNAQVRMWPPATGGDTLRVHHSKNQAALSAADEVVSVPSIPVYTLATALASRERGEVGGAPTSELFALSDRVLSDAIAVDSARFPEEMQYYNPRYVTKESL
jgi:hypothetical protein